MKFNPIFPILRTIEEARREVLNNPLCQQYAIEYREMTASELLTLYRQEAH